MGDDKVVSIFHLKEKATCRARVREEGLRALDAALVEFQEKFLNLVDPARRRVKATVYAANHAREWAEEGARLQALREQAGVSRTALAKALGVSPARIARLEVGLPVVDAKLLRAAVMMYLEKGNKPGL
ncbi:helix-turn-helix domain-containing protein [Desulfofundulus thermocisternus]|uniref:helix-turn-helix domain-containing protein n=1 Tax=Desulfofundulus thermocisternus TaxID=42471 RepID=UPI0009FF27AC|nr:helix-turn-helix transcriptional regulator [Desulfofundulus thermocisternus]